MEGTIRLILAVVTLIAVIPSFFFFPALIITGIVGIINKDYTYLKKYLKIWGYSLLVLILCLILHIIISFIVTMIGGV